MSLTGFGEIADLASTIINKFFPDKAQQDKDAAAAQLQVMLMQAQAMQAQADVNKTEAASLSIFVAGWRPFIGWVCGSGLGFQFILAPLGTWIAALAGHPIVFPTLDLSTLLTLLAGMLGLGGMRTFEKVNGINTGH
jgi:hypothetical protein